MQTPNNGHFEALWPRSPRQASRQAARLAPRLTTLNGKVVAQLWDYLFRGEEIFPVLEAELKARFPDVRFVSWRDIGNTHGSDERQVIAALPARLRELGVDAAISGIAA